MPAPRIITREERAARRGGKVGLGTAIKNVTTALGIEPCAGCRKRAARLDILVTNINPFA